VEDVSAGGPVGRKRERGEPREPGLRRLFVATGLALLLHLAVLLPAGYLLPEPTASREPRKPISVDLYETSLRALAPLLYEPPEPVPDGQVVDAPAVPTAESETPDDARFLGETAQHVARETRAHIRIAGPHRVGSSISAPGTAGRRAPVPGPLGPTASGPGSGEDPAQRGNEFILAAPGELGTAGEPGPVVDERGAAAAARPTPQGARSPLTDGTDGTSPLPRGDALALGVEEIAQAIAGSGIDRLEGVAAGDETALSTRPWAHAGFFRRVRDRVAQFWDVRGAFSHSDPLGSVYGYRDRETVVLVTLDCAGNLDGTILLEDSGARFLDELAVDSIAQAAPFHNPPQELCDPRRDIISFTFGFYVETDQGPSLRVQMGRP
jgi:hypothetical protein